MKRIFKEEVMGIHHEHQLWLAGEGGQRAVFKGRELNELDLIDCNFERADFSGCVIYNVKMPIALKYARFINTKLFLTDFTDRNLTQTNFTDAFCRACNFKNATLLNANFSTTKIQRCQFIDWNMQDCHLEIYNSKPWVAYIRPDFTSIGCQHHSNKDWKRFTNRQINLMHSSALRYWGENKSSIFMIMDSLKSQQLIEGDS